MLCHAFRSPAFRDASVYGRCVASMRGLAVLAGAALLLAAVPAHAQDAHGVIAFGETGGNAVAYGVSWNRDTRDGARQAAVEACVAEGGQDCIELARFRNGCGALALDQYGAAQGKSGMSREQAEARALKTCEAAGGSGCTMVGSPCASLGGEPDTWSGSENVLAQAEEKPAASRPATGGEKEALTREERVRVQRGLGALGFEAGPADGMFGPRTRSAIREWQKAKGGAATGYLTREEAGALAAAGRDAGKPAASSEAADGPRRSRNRVLHFPAAGPKCEGMPGGSSCWQEIADKPGCYVFNQSYNPDLTVTWSGRCEGDTAVGRGVLRASNLKEPEKFSDRSGEFVQGKEHGHWVIRYSNDAVEEGPYVDGKMHGRWVLRGAGNVFEGPFVDGKLHGRWIVKRADGTTGTLNYRNGEWVD